MKGITIGLILAVTLGLAGCMTAQEHHNTMPPQGEQRLTVGTVQREINKGMSGAEVAQALGSPNIVTKDSEGDETWVYDKISGEASYSHSQTGVGLLVLLFADHRQSAGVSRTSQKTLTIIIKFDQNKRVKEFSYHASRF